MIAASENCLVYGVSPSCTLRAAHFRAVVHDHDGGLGLCHDIRHARILLQSPYVIYENSAEGQGARCYRRFGRIDRYRYVEGGDLLEHSVKTVSSSASSIACASGRVDSAPISTISQPSTIICRKRARVAPPAM